MKLEIPQACQEDWTKMTPVNQGAFCGKCEKTVIDFTSWKKESIIAFFKKKNKSERVCGHFFSDQLGEMNWIDFIRKFELYPLNKKSLIIVGIAFCSFLFSGELMSQSNSEDQIKGKVRVEVLGEVVDPKDQEQVILPQYKGGKSALLKFIQKNKVYPKTASEKKVSGKVVVNFRVSEKGALSGFQVSQSLGYGCDEEAVRIARKMPAWIPAKRGKKNVAMECFIEVKF